MLFSYSETGGKAVAEGARVATEVERQSYLSKGYEEYEFIAEPKACDLCKPLDGKIFKVLDMAPGLNASPMHPHCRCATAAQYSGGVLEGESSRTLEKDSSISTFDKILKEAEKQAKINRATSLKRSVVEAIEKTNMASAVGLANYNQFLDKFDKIEHENLLKLYRKLGHKIEYDKLKGSRNFAVAHKVQLTQSAFDGIRTEDNQKYVQKPLSTVFHENGHALDSLGLNVLTKGKKVVIGEETVRMLGQKAKVSIYAKHASALPQYDLRNTIKRDFIQYITGKEAKENAKGIIPPKRAEKEKFIKEMRELQQTEPSAMAVLSDIMQGTGWFGSYPLGWGHKANYFKRLGATETEFFAEISELLAVDANGYEVVKSILPNSIDVYHQIVEDILGG